MVHMNVIALCGLVVVSCVPGAHGRRPREPLQGMPNFGQQGGAGCKFTCENPEQKPWMKSGGSFSSNGCGTQGIRLQIDDNLIPCCDLHDACYSVCGLTQDYCDKAFKKCFNDKCDGDGECLSQTRMIVMGTSLFGCGPFVEAQRANCDCLTPGAEYEDRVQGWLTTTYGGLGVDKSEEELRGLREKHLGKEGELVYKLLRKYGEQMIEFEGARAAAEPEKKDL